MDLTDKLKMGALGIALSASLSGCGGTLKVAHTRIPGPNKIILTINSEPQNARFYERGKYWCETPCKVVYSLDDKSYNNKVIETGKLIVAKEGYLPEVKKLRLKVDPSWKRYNDLKIDYSELFLLKGDPRYGYSISNNTNNNNSKTEITNKDSGFKELNNGLDFIYKLNILKAMSK